jgi:hypothetical protein
MLNVIGMHALFAIIVSTVSEKDILVNNVDALHYL